MTEIARLVDTSIFVDYLRGNETAKEWMNGFPKGELAYSVITAAELLAGCRNRREQDLVDSNSKSETGLRLKSDFQAILHEDE